MRFAETAPQSTGTNGLLAAAAQVVDGLRDHLLARARLPGDEDAGVGAGHPSDQVVDLLHGRGCADERAEPAQLAQLGPQRADLPLHLQGAGQVGQGHLEPGEIDRLGEVVGDAAAQGVHGGLHARVAGDQDDFGVGGALEAVQEVEPAAVGQLEVDEQDVGRVGRDLLARLVRAWRRPVAAKPSRLTNSVSTWRTSRSSSTIKCAGRSHEQIPEFDESFEYVLRGP